MSRITFVLGFNFEKYFSLTRSVKSSHEIEDRFWEGEKLSDLYTDLKEKELAELETSELVLVTIYDSYNNKKMLIQLIQQRG